MQALIIFATITAIFMAMTSFLGTVFEGGTALTLKRQAQINQIFQDVEFAVNEVILNQEKDLTAYPVLTVGGIGVANGLDDIGDKVPWSLDKLAQDPWGGDIEVVTQPATFPDTLFYDDPGPLNSVEAPIQAFALASGGPDGVIDLATAALLGAAVDYNSVMALETPVGSDDIIHTFSTRAAMERIWNNVFEAHRRAERAINMNYEQQFIAFLPTLENRYLDILANNGAAAAEAFRMGGWKIDSVMLQHSVTAVTNGIAFPDLYTASDSYYPEVETDPEQLGINVLDTVLPDFAFSTQDFVPAPASAQDVADNSDRTLFDINLLVGGGGPAVGEWSAAFQREIVVQAEF